MKYSVFIFRTQASVFRIYIRIADPVYFTITSMKRFGFKMFQTARKRLEVEVRRGATTATNTQWAVRRSESFTPHPSLTAFKPFQLLTTYDSRFTVCICSPITIHCICRGGYIFRILNPSRFHKWGCLPPNGNFSLLSPGY